MKTIQINLNNQIIIDQRRKKTVDINQIIMLRSFSNYTCLYLQNGSHRLTSHTLKHYESVLNNRGFIRVHRGYIVNKDCILKHDLLNSQLILTNGYEADISRRGHRKNKHLKKISII
jgi:DNA-binding LytR/AlgR family response regulator